ncbi:glutamate ABC transporter substrate-binding protein [Leucobacter sp. UCMA 4100]|uniref:glutamate ABC transporter substrate-binding protein n=1 Tax=Leucobacter sp. UCMA 4100 TaxID=2810534 RepID=UPI0022EB88C1|nr:glutamate ABC transporter substrate-binding protein [Leucobacter sp. UCMA 4100]MDA3146810.1 glutamate ABC transporter substrate-binding protein [Leucobacter sp. UCMA 4100]
MKFMKKAAVLVAAGALLLTGCSSDKGGNEEAGPKPEAVEFEAGTTMAKLQDAGKITVGTKFDQPLFGLKGLDSPEGFDIEVAKIIAAELGLDPEKDIEWVETVSANREPFIENGKVDIVVATYTINDTRKEVISFAGPYYIAGQDLLVLAGTDDIKGIDDVLDKTVCSVTGSTSLENLKTEGVKDTMATDTYSNCLEPLRAGKAAAVSTDNVILAGLADQNPGEFEVVENPFTEEPYGIGLKKDDEAFRNFINDSLEKAYDDGRWAKAWENTAGVVLSTPTPPAVERY